MSLTASESTLRFTLWFGQTVRTLPPQHCMTGRYMCKHCVNERNNGKGSEPERFEYQRPPKALNPTIRAVVLIYDWFC